MKSHRIRSWDGKVLAWTVSWMGLAALLTPAQAQTEVKLVDMTTNQWAYYQEGQLPPAQGATPWHAVNYDDSTWTSGTGPLGNETAGVIPYPFGTYLNLTAPGKSAQTLAYYFRTKFNWNGNAQNVVFVTTNYIDDGAVFYINGREAGPRLRIASGTVNYSTQASSATTPEGTNEVVVLSLTNAVAGQNVLAVEVHQNGTASSDVVFGLGMVARTLAPATITTQPAATLAATAGVPFSLSVTATGSDLRYQWYRNNTVVAGGTNATLTTTITTNSVSTYYVVVSNLVSRAQSANSVVTVTAAAPVITLQPENQQEEVGRNITNMVRVSGSPPFTYRWFKDGNPTALVTSATATNYVINNATIEHSGRYYVTISNSVGVVRSETFIIGVTLDTFGPQLVSASVTSAAIDTNKLTLRFNENVMFAAPANVNYAHSATNPANYSVAQLRGTTLTNFLSVTAVTGIGASNTVQITVNSNWLRGSNYVLIVNNVADTRTNLIALESWIGIGFVNSTNVVPFRSIWTFITDVNSQAQWDEWVGTNWNKIIYVNDNPNRPPYMWGAGNALFKADLGDENSVPCTSRNQLMSGAFPVQYFRTKWVWPTAATWPTNNLTAVISNVVDDGAVFYINGREVARKNVSATATVTWNTRPTGSFEPNCGGPITIPNFERFIVRNTNVLAVSLHQVAGDAQQDAYFDAQLNISWSQIPALPSEANQAPRVLMQRPTANTMRVYFTNAVHGFALEQASSITGPWLQMQPASKDMTISTTNSMRFIRLKQY